MIIDGWAIQKGSAAEPLEETMTTKHWFGHYIFEVENFMLGDQCARLIAHAEGIGFGEATINTAVG